VERDGAAEEKEDGVGGDRIVGEWDCKSCGRRSQSAMIADYNRNLLELINTVIYCDYMS
jgi:hypothetical protein